MSEREIGPSVEKEKHHAMAEASNERRSNAAELRQQEGENSVGAQREDQEAEKLEADAAIAFEEERFAAAVDDRELNDHIRSLNSHYDDALSSLQRYYSRRDAALRDIPEKDREEYNAVNGLGNEDYQRLSNDVHTARVRKDSAVKIYRKRTLPYVK